MTCNGCHIVNASKFQIKISNNTFLVLENALWQINQALILQAFIQPCAFRACCVVRQQYSILIYDFLFKWTNFLVLIVISKWRKYLCSQFYSQKSIGNGIEGCVLKPRKQYTMFLNPASLGTLCLCFIDIYGTFSWRLPWNLLFILVLAYKTWSAGQALELVVCHLHIYLL